MKAIKIIRIDPYRRTVAAMLLKGVRDATPQIRRIIRANNIGSRQVMAIDDAPLMVIGGLEVDEAMKGWRFPGTDDTAGISMLTGRDENRSLLIDVPVRVDWVLDRIQWLDGEDVGARADRAEEMIPALNDDVRAALAAAVVTPDGDIWLPADHKAKVGPAMVTLGLGTERSGGQLLTPLGEAVFDKLGAR